MHLPARECVDGQRPPCIPMTRTPVATVRTDAVGVVGVVGVVGAVGSPARSRESHRSTVAVSPGARPSPGIASAAIPTRISSLAPRPW